MSVLVCSWRGFYTGFRHERPVQPHYFRRRGTAPTGEDHAWAREECPSSWLAARVEARPVPGPGPPQLTYGRREYKEEPVKFEDSFLPSFFRREDVRAFFVSLYHGLPLYIATGKSNRLSIAVTSFMCWTKIKGSIFFPIRYRSLIRYLSNYILFHMFRITVTTNKRLH